MKTVRDFEKHLKNCNSCGERFLITKEKQTTNLFADESREVITTIQAFCKSYFCPNCSKLIISKYRRRIRANLQNHQWRFLTLTTVNNYSNTKENMLQINQDWNKLKAILTKRFGKFEYVKSMEIGKSGMVHLHVILNKFIPKKVIRKYWYTYTKAYKVDISKVKSHELVLYYVTKYLTKITNADEFNKLFYLLNRRRLTFSKLFSLNNKIKSNFTRICPQYFSSQKLVQFFTTLILQENYNYEDFNFSRIKHEVKEFFVTDFIELLNQVTKASSFNLHDVIYADRLKNKLLFSN